MEGRVREGRKRTRARKRNGEELASEDISELKLLQEHIHDNVGQLVAERTGRRPMILPVVVEV